MDKSWVHKNRVSKEYDDGVVKFLNYAFSNGIVTEEKTMKCPCAKCRNVPYVDKGTIHEHLICNGMMKSYTKWYLHGEGFSSRSHVQTTEDVASRDDCDDNEHDEDIGGMLRDVFGVNDTSEDIDGVTRDIENDDTLGHKFSRFLEESKKELYPGCDKMTMLSFLIKLWNYKCIGGWSDKSFKLLLQLLRDVLPNGCTLPKNFTQCKKVISDLGLSYNKIDACPNDCILYYKENSALKECSRCGLSRYKDEEKKTPAKILRHFPLKPRLQRLYTSTKIATDMRWHEEGRNKDGILRHPADSMAWKDLDERYPTFAAEPRNIRLGLASDGFNPFGTMSVSHSTWPVLLIPYNLPPWLCMKQPNIILSLLIPGPHSPGNDIDVYLRPLIDELKELWEEGIDTYDSSKKETFKMHAALLWTISDYPGLAMLSGWSTKGKMACSTCYQQTSHMYLSNWRKTCYMGHRRFLPSSHRFRKLKKDFDGAVENRVRPNPLLGPDILEILRGVPHIFGKKFEKNLKGDTPTKKRARVSQETPSMPYNWKKLSIFYELPYWEHNILKHNLDVMHIEKNLCDNILGTIMGIEGKSKDNLKARWDLVSMGIRQELHPKRQDNGSFYIPAACYYMDKSRKEMFCNVLKNIKSPDGFSSNIARCVDVKQQKVYGLKSHDSHVIIQQFLPLAIRKTLPKKVTRVLIQLSTFFRELCSKVNREEDYQRLEDEIPVILCNLERIFPPTFFDIMVHLPIHLASEARIGGPVHFRWMYPIERFLHTLKSYVRNKAHPEGSIAEGYISNECVTFLTRYMDNVESHSNRPLRYQDNTPIGGGNNFILSYDEKRKIHQYILSNDVDVSYYINQHKATLDMSCRKMPAHDIQNKHKEEFPEWFKVHLDILKRLNHEYPEKLDLFATGPLSCAKRFKGYTINGYKFKIVSKETKAKTQKSGVALDAIAPCFSSVKDRKPVDAELTYYGRVTDIIEVSYRQNYKFVIFKCDWVDVAKGRGIKVDDLGFTLVNFAHLLPTQNEEPYVLASQVRQVFYVQDPSEPEWNVVVKNNPRDTFDMGSREDNDHLLDSDPFLIPINVNLDDEEISIVNMDVLGEIVSADEPTNVIQNENDARDEVDDEDVELEYTCDDDVESNELEDMEDEYTSKDS